MLNRRSIFVTFAALAMIGATVLATLHGQSQNSLISIRQDINDQEQTPIADYDAPEPADPEKRAKRKAKGKRYDQQKWVITPHPDATSTGARRVDHSMFRTPAIPAASSNTIIIGEVAGAEAFLSNDKSGVYTEFAVRIDEVLKNDSEIPLMIGSTTEVTRPGGRVRFPSGHIGRYQIHFQGMPRVGRKYLLFLKRMSNDPSFFIYTGYELRAGRIYPLDGVDVPGGGDEIPHFARRKNADAAAFLNEVREAIANSLQTPNQ